MNDFEKRVLNVIEQYGMIEQDEKIIVGFSGGPDSTALMECLYTINKESDLHFKIIAVHVNHGIRENAKKDVEFVKNYCKTRKIEFEVIDTDVPSMAQDLKRGLEEVGRIVRYNAFKQVADENQATTIAVAHNKKDKVETILMNAMRGCGMVGLQGIQEVQFQNDLEYVYIRPLLQESREDIEKYLKGKKIKPCIDESNFDNTYTRNKIRNVVIPYIEKEFNPNFIDGMIRMSDIVKEDADFLDGLAEEAFEQVLDESSEEQIVLDLKKFNNQARSIQKRILLISITMLFGSTQGIEQVHVNDMVQLCNNNVGNKYLTPNKNTQIVIKNKKIIINRVR